nr:reverse transcriptase domain-containing protein [Tanacetum cinerariifolium]
MEGFDSPGLNMSSLILLLLFTPSTCINVHVHFPGDLSDKERAKVWKDLIHLEMVESCEFPIEALYFLEILGWFLSSDCLNLLGELSEHSLGLNQYATPIRHKRRNLSPERSQAMDSKFTDLIKLGILRSVEYQTWVANLVLVKKRIADFKYKCFLDAYKGYHQIPMMKSNEQKTRSLELKFGVNLEAYVDDTVIKSKTEYALTGIPKELSEHSLGLNQYATPIQHKRRNLSPERSQAMDSKFTDLIKLGILRSVEYQTWVANLVLVKKRIGTWCMCVDFTSLNKACPKDNYPLP